MAPLFGVLAGTGLFLIWWSFWEKPAARKRRPQGQPHRGLARLRRN